MEKDEKIKELKMCFDNLFYIWLGFGSLRSPSFMHYVHVPHPLVMPMVWCACLHRLLQREEAGLQAHQVQSIL